MGSSSSKPNKTNLRREEQIRCLEEQYGQSMNLTSFLKQFHLPETPEVSTDHKCDSSLNEKLWGNQVGFLYEFGVLFFRGLCAINITSDLHSITLNYPLPDVDNKLVLPKEKYVYGLLSLANDDRSLGLVFLLDLYHLRHSPVDGTTPNSSTLLLDSKTILISDFKEFLLHIIALINFLSLEEERQITDFGYLMPGDLPEETNSSTRNNVLRSANYSNNDPDSAKDGNQSSGKASADFYKTKQPQDLDKHFNSLSIKPSMDNNNEQDFGHIFIPKQETKQFDTSFVVPKDHSEVSNDVDQNEENLLAEKRCIESHKRIKHISKRVLSILVNSILDECGSEKQGSTKKSLLKSEIIDWIVINQSKLFDTLKNLIQLYILKPLSLSAPEYLKQSYIRIAAQPKAIGMENSTLWSPVLFWTIGLFFNDTQLPGYDAPTLILIYTDKGSLFGAYMSTKWISSVKYTGDSKCFLWSLIPEKTIKRAQINGMSNYAYFCTKGTYHNVPVGIGFGGDVGNFRLFIDNDLTSGNCRTIDSTYENGPISDHFEFNISQIEIWGSGSECNIGSIQRERNLRDFYANRAKNLVKENWQNNPDKFIMDIMGKTGFSGDMAQE